MLYSGLFIVLGTWTTDAPIHLLNSGLLAVVFLSIFTRFGNALREASGENKRAIFKLVHYMGVIR